MLINVKLAILTEELVHNLAESTPFHSKNNEMIRSRVKNNTENM